VQGLRSTALKERRVQRPYQEEYGTVFMFVSLQGSSFSSSAGTYARLEEYNYEE
jgi:hypothetical protein